MNLGTLFSGPWVASLSAAEVAAAHAAMVELVAEVARQARARGADVATALAAAQEDLEAQSRGLDARSRLALLQDSVVEARVEELGSRTLPLVRAVADGTVRRDDEVVTVGRRLAGECEALKQQARARGLDLEGELADLETEIRFILEGGAASRRMR
jgi:hypothetical protein